MLGGNKKEGGFPNFFPSAQNDFAVRMKWSVTSAYKDANHEPVISIKGPLDLNAHSGEKIQLSARISDPDGNHVSVKWWQFRVGSYPKEAAIENPGIASTSLIVPEDAKPGQTIHFVIEATDNGSPALTSYKRIIIMVNR